VPQAARASLITVANASFETPNVADNAFTDSDNVAIAVPNWTLATTLNGTITTGVWDPINADFSNTTGDNAAIPGGAGGQVGYIYLEQFNDLAPEMLTGELTTESSLATIQNNTIYTLTVSLGSSKTSSAGDVLIELYSNNTLRASTNVPAGTLPEDTLVDYVASFTTSGSDPNAGGPLVARIIHNYSGPGAREVEFDNVRVDVSPVPEPTSTSLALLALAALTTRRRSNRR
jgi:MYXO-CTERM domain-containing protein